MGTPIQSGNRGVLALGASLVNLCAQTTSEVEVFLLLVNRDNRPVSFRIGGREQLVPVVHTRMSPSSRIRDHLAWIVLMSLVYRLLPISGVRSSIRKNVPWIQAVAEADLVGDIRGGDSFSDIYGLKRFVLAFLPVWSVLLVKGGIVQFPQTYGPFKNPLAKGLAKFILNRSMAVIARDTRSKVAAEKLVGPGTTIYCCPDVAFSLEVVRPAMIKVEPPYLDDGGVVAPGVVGLNVNGLMYNGGYTRSNMFGLKMDYSSFLSELISALLLVHSGEIWLIPHTFAPKGNVESDPCASIALRDSLAEHLRKRVRIVIEEYDQHQIKGIIGQCDMFIGSRMHACIAALSQGVPCVGVAYSMKFGGVFDSVGMADWVVDARAKNNEEAVKEIVELYLNRDAVREPLAKRAAAARVRLQEIFCDLICSARPFSTVPPKEIAFPKPSQIHFL